MKSYEKLMNEEKECYAEKLANEIQQTCLKYCEVPRFVEAKFFAYPDENLQRLERNIEIRFKIIENLEKMNKELKKTKEDEILAIELDADCTDAKKLENKQIIDVYIRIANLEINHLIKKIKQDICNWQIEMEKRKQEIKPGPQVYLGGNDKKIENKVAKEIYEMAITECQIFFEDIAKRIIKSSSNAKKRLTKKEKAFVMGQAITEFLTNFQEQEDKRDYMRIGQKFMELFAEKEQEFKLNN